MNKNLLLRGGGEMAQRIRDFDWSQTELGPFENWSHTFVSIISTCLSSSLPMAIFLGDKFVMLYNDAYVPIIGTKHPTALGQTCDIVYPEVWKGLGTLLVNSKGGQPIRIDDHLYFILNDGKLEERYFTYSMSPIINAYGITEGVLNPVIETTAKVIEQRRTKTLKDIAMDSDSLEQTLSYCMKSIANNPKDFPFALLFRAEKNSLKLHTSSVVSIDISKNNIPHLHEIQPLSTANATANNFTFFLDRCFAQNKTILIEGEEIIQHCFPSLELSIFDDPISKVALLPIYSTEQDGKAGILVLGLNTRRPFDKNFQTFLDLLSRQISQVIASATSIEQGRKKAEELAKIDAAKTEFFNNVSHEFRTPLALMLGPLADSLADTQYPLDPVQRARIDLIQRNASRLLKLVNTLLNFSRIEAGKMEAMFVPINITKLTNSLCALFETVIKQSELQYILDIEHIQETMFVDVGMYEKIVMNLLSNAYKFTLQGYIRIRLIDNKKENSVELRVEDTGVGIPEEEIPNLFTRFHRVQNSKGRSFEGSGIGLAMIHELVKVHHGTLKVQSNLGKGTHFIVTFKKGKDHLPLDRVHEQDSFQENEMNQFFVDEAKLWISEESSGSTSAMNSPSQSQENIINGKVLLVDDNKDMRSYISTILKQYWTVEIVTNGEEALQLLEKESFDVIVSDVMMPVMNGFEMIQKIRLNPKLRSIPIILLSARAGDEAKIEGLVRGADDYLVKTNFSAKELVARVNVHMELAKLRYNLEEEIMLRTKELKQVNQELQIENQKRIQSENRYKLLANSAPVGIFHLNQIGTVLYANEFLLQTLQLEKEFENCSIFDMIHAEDLPTVTEKWNSFLRNPDEQQLKSIHRIICKDGNIKWIYLQIISESISEEGEAWFIGTQTDITVMKHLEEQNLKILKESEEQQRLRAVEAELSKKQKEEFIDTVCHEIRNPLNGIIGNVDMLTEKLEELRHNQNALPIPDQLNYMKQSLQSIQECATHQADITNDVLSLSRLEAGKEELNEITCDTNQTIVSVLNMFSSHTGEKNIQVQLELFPENNQVLIDPLKWKQIVINLFVNAIKFSKQNGIIRVAKSAKVLSDDQIQLNLEIEDDGIGLDEMEQRNLFGKFYQVTHSIGGKYNGSGLGLAITSRLVHLMHGEISVKSTKHKGSTFIVSLCCKPAPISTTIKEEKIKAVTPASASNTPQHSTVLLVEDNEINQKVLKNLIQKKGFVCEIANNGKEAVQLCGQKSYCLIFMDIVMPEMDGYEATKQIRKLESQSLTPIIAVSGNARAEYITKAKEIGMTDYICKPFRPDMIFQILDKYVDRN